MIQSPNVVEYEAHSSSLVTTTIADIYFVHQRGLRLAMWGLCLSVGVGGGSIISGYIIEGMSVLWCGLNNLLLTSIS